MSLVTARLADSPLLPINATHYAHILPFYISLLQDSIATYPGAELLDLAPLHEASKSMLKKAEKFEKESEEVRKQLEKNGKDKKGKHGKGKHGKKKRGHDDEGKKLKKKRDDINHRGMLLERSFIDSDGSLPDRPWYKHVIFAPGKWAGYAAQPFPGIADWVAAGNIENAQETVEKVAEIIRWAGKNLDG
ncbi:transferrin receptor-like protein [Endogone sp. FLAS-F59071]|nr:transferrin receptor-like protein [Endogone sp. FLAS-F59071]|eukprot:RUS20487.1 transferrin receptor-like protein [Endogone sp. FLAS-F59071]